MITNDEIILCPFDLSLLSSDFTKWTYCEITKDSPLILLGKLDLTAKDLEKRSFQGVGSRASLAVHANSKLVDMPMYDKALERARAEIRTTGLMSGFKLLNLCSMETLWVSHIDLEFLLQVSKPSLSKAM